MDYLTIIRQKRKEAGLTQDEMAKLLNIPRSTYQSIEGNIVGLKVHDFLRIIKILDIPLEIFQEKDYIVISQEDFVKLKESSDAIKTISDKIEQNINITNNNIINMNFTNDHEVKSRKQNCRVCNEPSGFYPFCKKHAIMKINNRLYQEENGNWKEK